MRLFYCFWKEKKIKELAETVFILCWSNQTFCVCMIWSTAQSMVARTPVHDVDYWLKNGSNLFDAQCEFTLDIVTGLANTMQTTSISTPLTTGYWSSRGLFYLVITQETFQCWTPGLMSVFGWKIVTKWNVPTSKTFHKSAHHPQHPTCHNIRVHPPHRPSSVCFHDLLLKSATAGSDKQLHNATHDTEIVRNSLIGPNQTAISKTVYSAVCGIILHPGLTGETVLLFVGNRWKKMLHLWHVLSVQQKDWFMGVFHDDHSTHLLLHVNE